MKIMIYNTIIFDFLFSLCVLINFSLCQFDSCKNFSPAPNNLTCLNQKESESFYCCHAKPELNRTVSNSTSTGFCLKVAKSTLNEYKFSKVINQTNYTIECPNVDEKLNCGLDNPTIASQCHNDQSRKINDTCCFYSYNDAGNTGCFWYGGLYKNKYTQGGLTIDCIERKLNRTFKDNLMLILLLIIGFF